MKTFLRCLILILLSVYPYCAEGGQQDAPSSSPRILILNSYHPGYTWSDAEIEGIRPILKQRYPLLRPAIEYLDCKNFSRMQHFEREKDLFLEKYGTDHFSIVIVLDNPALEFAVKYQSALFPNVPIVFCGINGFQASMLHGEKNITGITEDDNVLGTIQLIMKIHPDTKDIVVLHDYTTTGIGSRHEAEDASKQISESVKFHYLADAGIDHLIDTIRTLQPGTVVLALSYTRDMNGRIFNQDEQAKIVSENSPVPVYGIHMGQLGSGIVGGVLLDGGLHGEHAARMAVDILDGRLLDSIGITHESSFSIGFDEVQIQRYHINPSRIPLSAAIINQPDSFYIRNQALVLNALIVFMILLSLVILLSVNTVRRKKAERALRETAQMYKDLIESIPDGIYKRNREDRFIEVNSAMVKILGYDSKEDLLSVNIRTQLFFSNEERSAALTEARVGKMFVFRLRKKDGSEIWVEDHASIHTDNAGLVLYHEGIMRDITERVHSERQLLQAQKLDGIGTLAGGIAHDFNNLLAMILGSAELLKGNVADQPKLEKYVDRIIEASERGTSISRQLLIFSRPDQAELKPISLSHIIKGLKEMLQHFLPKSIAIVTMMDVDQGIIMGDAGQIHQALLNLAINAGDAMTNHGTLTIREYTASPEFIKKRFKCDAAVPFAAVSVADTGIGMNAGTVEKIFEPFFSTKEQGKGTGLGLSIVHGIVKNHQGFIDVESEPGKGTNFTIYIPSIPHEEAKDSARAARGQHQYTETILLVDDEEILRETLAEYLTDSGYCIYTASNGADALNVYMAHRGSIDAVVTDLGMPGMGGEELFRQLKKIDPTVPVIVSSGYLDGTTKESLLQMGIRAVLTKPFRIREIPAVIHSVLTTQAAAEVIPP